MRLIDAARADVRCHPHVYALFSAHVAVAEWLGNNGFTRSTSQTSWFNFFRKFWSKSRTVYCYNISIENPHIADSTMVKEIIDLLVPIVRGMVRILNIPVDDGEMRELTSRVGQTSKWERT